MDETLAALTELVHEGKVRYIGSSNLAGWQVADAEWLSRTRGHERFVSAQNHYSLLDRQVEAELVPACERYGVGLLPYFPLASGLLTGKYRRGEPAPEGTRLAGARFAGQMTDDAVRRRRGARGLRRRAGALAARRRHRRRWRPSPRSASVIAGATPPDQVKANVAAGRWIAHRRRPRRPRRHRPTVPLTFPLG